MVNWNITGKDVVKTLRKHDFHIVRTEGSHYILKRKDKNTGEVRTVTVPYKMKLCLKELLIV